MSAPQIKILMAGEILGQVKKFYKTCGKSGSALPTDLVIAATQPAQSATPGEEEIVGVVRLVNENGFHLLRGMNVKPSCQRQGIGSRILQEFQREAKTRVEGSPIYCLPWARLERFYRRFGFKRIEPTAATPLFIRERLALYQDIFGETVLMRLDLKGPK